MGAYWRWNSGPLGDRPLPNRPLPRPLPKTKKRGDCRASTDTRNNNRRDYFVGLLLVEVEEVLVAAPVEPLADVAPVVSVVALPVEFIVPVLLVEVDAPVVSVLGVVELEP
jgi:hypothetical protein